MLFLINLDISSYSANKTIFGSLQCQEVLQLLMRIARKCAYCFGKTKMMINLKGKVLESVRKHDDYNVNGDRLPTIICSGYNRDIFRIEDGVGKTVILLEFDQVFEIARVIEKEESYKCNLSTHLDNLITFIKEPPTKSLHYYKKKKEDGNLKKNVTLAVS